MAYPEHSADIKEEKKADDLVILRISGKLDTSCATAAEKKIEELVQKGYIKLVMDLSQVTYLSSAGIRMLLAATRTLGQVSGKFAVCNPSPLVLDILKMSGFDHVLKIFNTEEDALQHI